MQILAPAKINLGLRILGRRDDGFHEIDTLMVPLAFGDTVGLESAPGDEIRLEVHPPIVAAGPGNLAWRAASILRDRTGVRRGVSIRIEKRIPVGSGLGGGSSDAAAVLKGLNRLWALGLEETILASWGAELGSDVPFFVVGRCCRCRGRGERLDPVGGVGPFHVLLANPGFEISTAWAYESVDRSSSCLTGDSAENSLAHRIRQHGAVPALRNDFEDVVFRKYPLLEWMKEELEQTDPLGASLSGSGATVFSLYETAEAAGRAAGALRERFGPGTWLETTVSMP